MDGNGRRGRIGWMGMGGEEGEGHTSALEVVLLNQRGHKDQRTVTQARRRGPRSSPRQHHHRARHWLCARWPACIF